MSSGKAGAGGSPLARAHVERALRHLAPPLPPELAASAGELSPETGRFLEAIAASEPAGRVLLVETGAEIGRWVRRGLRRGTVVAVERGDAGLDATRRAVDTAGAAGWEGRTGEPLAALDAIAGPFHLAVLGNAREARRLVDHVLPKLLVGGRLLVVGALRDLALRAECDDAERAALERLRPYLAIHPQLATSLLPVGDGIAFAVKRRETIRELGGPY